MEDYHKYIEDLFKFKKYCTQFRDEGIELKTDNNYQLPVSDEDREFYKLSEDAYKNFSLTLSTDGHISAEGHEITEYFDENNFSDFIKRLYEFEKIRRGALKNKTFVKEQVDFLKSLHPQIKDEYKQVIDFLSEEFENYTFISPSEDKGYKPIEELPNKDDAAGLFCRIINDLGIVKMEDYGEVGEFCKAVFGLYKIPFKIEGESEKGNVPNIDKVKKVVYSHIIYKAYKENKKARIEKYITQGILFYTKDDQLKKRIIEKLNQILYPTT